MWASMPTAPCILAQPSRALTNLVLRERKHTFLVGRDAACFAVTICHLHFPMAICSACSGGVAGLSAAWVIGPRLGRFNGSEVKPIVGHNVESIALGTFLLWMGWCAPSSYCPNAKSSRIITTLIKTLIFCSP